MTDWNKSKVVDLKAELKKRGLPQTGLKPALVARLTAAENGEGSESEATIQDDVPKQNAGATSPDTISPIQAPQDPIAEALLATPPQSSPQPHPESTQDVEPGSDAHEPAIGRHQNQSQSQSPEAVDSSLAPSQADTHNSALPSVEPQELLEDRQKRKRRSQSPPISAADVSKKRARQDDSVEAMEGVSTRNQDATWVGEAAPVEKYVQPESTIIDFAKEEVKIKAVPKANTQEAKAEGASSEPLEESPSRTRDSRFKGLFSAPQQATAMETSKSHDSYETSEIEQHRVVSPAIHPATSALYIRDFMRPLNPLQLQNHLATLATPPGREVDQEVIVDFHLDPIRTHAFISFTNTSSASRVRSALHGSIWPEERTRKPLWVDFIPLEKIHDWINQEQSTSGGGRAAAKKWEVVYDTDEDRHVTAYLEEISSMPTRPPPPRQPSLPISAPVPAPVTAPRGIQGAPTGPRAGPVAIPRPVTNTKALDELFKSTQAKPLLYWQPVDKALANKRLDNLDDRTSKDYVRGTGGEINRYTFEDGDVLVDRGPEIFSGIRPPGGHRGGSRGGGFRGSGFRGGYQGRGGFGGADRSYDSYRGGRAGGGDRRDSRDDRRY